MCWGNGRNARVTNSKDMNEHEVVRRLKRCNWIVLALLTALSAIILNYFFALSVLIGGVLIIANFSLLYRVLLKSLNPNALKPAGYIIITSFLRLGATGAIMLALLVLGVATPLGLIVGLSTVVLSLTTCGIFIIKQAWMKEA